MNNTKRTLLVCVHWVVVLMATPFFSYASVGYEAPVSGVVSTDRYTLADLAPRHDQLSPLDSIVNISFSTEVENVGQALVELIDGSGYELIHLSGEYGQPVDTILMSQVLPKTLQSIGPVPMREALDALAGPAWRLKTNELGRELWFELHEQYNDDKTIRRLLIAQQAEQSELNQKGEWMRYIRYPSGKTELTNTSFNDKQVDEIVQRIHKYQDALTGVSVKGLSMSQKSSAKAELAKQRASDFAQKLIDRGVNPELLLESYAYENHQEKSLHGVTVTLKVDPDTQLLGMKKDLAQPKRSIGTGAAIVPVEDIYRFKRGEDLESALARWVNRAGYKDLVWNVRNDDGDFVRIPIRASAVFTCDFQSCLRKVKDAYASAQPKPLYFDIAVKEANKVVYVELLRYGAHH